MFQIFISNPAAFSASTLTLSPGGVNGFDTQLFLFNSLGLGIVANDDNPSGSGSQSSIPAGNSFTMTLAPGIYYLLIDGSGRYPVSQNGLIFPNFTSNNADPTVVYGPTGPGGALPINGFTGNSSEGGKYSIALTGAQFVVVPEPSTVVAIASGLTLLLFASHRRRR